MYIPHIPEAEDLQIPGLIPDTTNNAGVPENVEVGKYKETPDQNTAEQAATDATSLSGDDRPPYMTEKPAGACLTRENNISYGHLHNPNTTAVPAFNKTKSMADGSIKYAFEFLSMGAIEGFLLFQTAQISMKLGIKELGDAGVDAVHKETKQLHGGIVSIPVDPRKLSYSSKATVLK